MVVTLDTAENTGGKNTASPVFSASSHHSQCASATDGVPHLGVLESSLDPPLPPASQVSHDPWLGSTGPPLHFRFTYSPQGVAIKWGSQGPLSIILLVTGKEPGDKADL